MANPSPDWRESQIQFDPAKFAVTVQPDAFLYNIPVDNSETFKPEQFATTGLSVQEQIREAARVLPEGNLIRFAKWAGMHPTMDPHVWVPAAMQGIQPEDEIGKQLAQADMGRQMEEGTYGVVKGEPGSISTDQSAGVGLTPALTKYSTFGGFMSQFQPPPPTEEETKEAAKKGKTAADIITGLSPLGALLSSPETLKASPLGKLAGATEKVAEGTQGVTTPVVAPVAQQAGARIPEPVRHTAISGLESAVVAPVQFSARTAMTALMAPRELVYATIRDQAAGDETKDQFTKKYGLDSNQQDYVFGRAAQEQARGLVANPLLKYSSAEQDRLRKIRAEYAAAAPAFSDALRSAYNQTTLAGVIRHPGDLTKNLGQFNKLESYLPPKRALAEQARAAQLAYDWRTADQIAAGVARSAATPGRLLAASLHLDPEGTAFEAVSGYVDFAAATVGDPVNWIPAGAAASGVRALGRGAELTLLGASRLSTPQLPRLGASLARASEYTPGFLARAVAGDGEYVGVRALSGAPPGPRVPAWESATQSSRDAYGGHRAAGLPEVNDPDLLASVRSNTRVDPVTGLVRTGYKGFVMRQRALDFLESARGTLMVDRLVKETSAARIWALSNRQFDAELSMKLADAKTAGEVRAAIGTRLGSYIQDPRALKNLSSSAPAMFRNGVMRDHWLFNAFRTSPNLTPFKLEEKTESTLQLERYGRSVGLSWDDMQPHLDKIMRAANGPERYDAIYAKDGFLMKPVLAKLTAAGAKESDARALLQAFKGGLDNSERMYNVTNLPTAYGALPDGTPGLLADHEALHQFGVLPSVRDVKRATGMIGKIRNAMGASPIADDIVTHAITGATSAWRTGVLVRPAYILRTTGEEIFSMGMAGYSGMFTHPFSFIAAATGVAMQKAASNVAGRLAKAALTGQLDKEHMQALAAKGARDGRPLIPTTLSKVASYSRRAPYYAAATNPLALANRFVFFNAGVNALMPRVDLHMARVNGDGLWESFGDAIKGLDQGAYGIYAGMAATGGQYMRDENAARQAMNSVKQARRDSPAQRNLYDQAWTDKVLGFHMDIDMRRAADPNLTDAERLALFRATTRERKAVMRPDKLTNPGDDILMMQGYQHNLNLITMGDAEVQEAVLTGKFAGEKIGMKNRAWRAKLDEMIATQPDNFPPTLNYRSFNRERSDFLTNRADEFFMWAGEFADIFARGPLVRQAYTRMVTQLGEQMSPAAKQQIVANLRNVGDIKLAKTVQSLNAKGHLGVDEIDSIASGFARSEMKRIFYDAHRRQNWALSWRVVAPFAQATFNTFYRWGRMSLANPQFAYRSIKPMYALTQPGSAAIYDIFRPVFGMDDNFWAVDPGHPENSFAKDGFFFTNGYGERNFIMPAVGPLTRLFAKLTPGMPRDIPSGWAPVAKMSGLNVAGQTYNPGAGPWITTLASALLPNMARRSDLRGDLARAMFPFGLSQGNILEQALATWMPTVAKRLVATTDDEQMGRATVSIMPALMGTGDYDLDSDADRTRLLHDSGALATRLAFWSAIGSFMTPTVYADEAIVKTQSERDPDAPVRWQMASVLAQELQKYTTGDDPDAYNTGLQNFVLDYGVTALFSALPATESIGREGMSGPQATRDVWEFSTSHPETFDKHVGAIGLFFPAGASDPGYLRTQRELGQRRRLTPEERLLQVEDRLGWMLYNQKTAELDKLGLPTDQASAIRKQIQEDVHGRWRSWTPTPGGGEKETIRRMDWLRDAVNDPNVMSIPSAPYIKRYLDLIDQGHQILQTSGFSQDFTTKDAYYVAAQLYTRGHEYSVADTSGGFRNAYNQVFSKLLPNDWQ